MNINHHIRERKKIRQDSSKSLRKGEQGVSPIISAVLIIAIIFAAFSIIIIEVVPAYQKKNELNNYHILKEKMIDLQSAILSKTDTEITIPMGSEPAPITSAKSSAEFKARPAKAVLRIPPVEDAYVDQGDSTTPHNGNDNGLWVASYDGTYPIDPRYPSNGPTANARTFLKFDLSKLVERGISSKSISEARLVIFDEYLTKFPFAGWAGADPNNPQVPSALGDMPDMPILVEAREVGNQDWQEENITWSNQPSLGDEIVEQDFPEADNHGVSENQVWMEWGVTFWVKDQLAKYSEGSTENVSFSLKTAGDRENSTQLRAARFSQREGSTMSLNETTGHPPYSKPHLTIIYDKADPQTGEPLPGDPVIDNWGPFVDGGLVSLMTNYSEFPDYKFTFESGALLSQIYGFTGDLMTSPPSLVVPQRNYSDDNKISIYVNRYRITNWEEASSNTDAKLKVEVEENTDFTHKEWVENLLVTINTDFVWPWKYYFRDVVDRWNNWTRKGGFATMGSGFADVFETVLAKFFVDRNTRLYIPGPVHGDSDDLDSQVDEDIYYVDRTYDVEVHLIAEE